MKRYIKNKNFLPESFYNKVEKERIKNENKVLILFLTINIFLAPILIMTIKKMKTNKIETQNSMINIQYDDSNIDNIKIWIENIMTDDIDEAYIDNNKGEIKVGHLGEINKLSSSNKIEISNLELNSDEGYTLGVILNE